MSTLASVWRDDSAYLELSAIEISPISAGIAHAITACVTSAKHYTDLIVWQLADAIRVEAFKLTRRPPFNQDFKLQSQTEDAIDSVCRNAAEGFGCESHKEFARFLEFSRRSLNEVMDCLGSAKLKGYVTEGELKPIRQLSARLYPALSRFIAYLRTTKNPSTDQRKQDRTDRRRPNRTDERKEDRTD